MHFKLKSISSVLTKSTVNNTDLLEMLLTGPNTLRGENCQNKLKTCKFNLFLLSLKTVFAEHVSNTNNEQLFLKTLNINNTFYFCHRMHFRE